VNFYSRVQMYLFKAKQAAAAEYDRALAEHGVTLDQVKTFLAKNPRYASSLHKPPHAYAGVAAFMPFVGFSPKAPHSLAGSPLRRVMFAYSNADPALPPSYATEVLVPLAREWARALNIPERDIGVPEETPLDDTVNEGSTLEAADEVVRATRDSTVKRLDLRSVQGALRQLVFDHAGHFWPTRDHADPAPVLAEFGLRNQDIEGAEEAWRFFRE